MTRRLSIVLTALCIAGLMAAPDVSATPADGMVVGATKIVDNGPDSDRFDLVLIAEGYTEAELGQFAADAQAFVDFFLETPPFSTNCSAFNVWRIDVASTQSGADDPAACAGGTGASVDTYFDSTFCADGVIRRLLGADGATATSVLNANVPGWDQALVVVNSATYGGSGGTVGVTSLSGAWELIAVHEIGHAAFGLADEYPYWAGCGETGHDNHPAVEPVQPNVTIETDRTLVKWGDLIDMATAVPTTQNADCTQCDPQPDPSPGDVVVGLYEGAHYYHCDVYRPDFDCMMRNFAPFCPVCTRRILQTLEPFQPVNSPPVCDANGPYLAECENGGMTVVQLDGSGSSDPDCDELDFSWTGGFVESPADGEMPSVTFDGLGTFDVDLEVSDGELADACSTQVTVEDTTPPDVMAPEDVTAECTSPEGTPVELGDPVVVDVCDLTPDVVNDAPDLFPLGDTAVTWTATDASGNVGSDQQLVSVVDTTPPDLVAPPDITAECTSPNGTPVELGMPIVSDICDDMVDVTNDAPLLFPLGTTVVTWTAVDDSGNASMATQQVTIVDTTPPELSLEVSPTELWPPNHKLVSIDATIEVSDICDAEPEVRLESITSNEPDNANGIGDGNTTGDIRGADFGSDDRRFRLRAERAGTGSGRVYTITYVAEDDSGNTTTRQAEVTVPKSRGKGKGQP